MIEQIKMVEAFHESSEIENGTSPRLLDEKDWLLRANLQHEELTEYMDACTGEDLVEVTDALADSLYILYGTILRHGLQHIITQVFAEVQRSNMSKFDENGKAYVNGRDGVLDPSKPIGKVLKGPNYSQPNIKQFLNGSY